MLVSHHTTCHATVIRNIHVHQVNKYLVLKLSLKLNRTNLEKNRRRQGIERNIEDEEISSFCWSLYINHNACPFLSDWPHVNNSIY